MKQQDLRTIKSAHRVLEILEYFDRDHHTATVMDLARSLNYPQSSTSELLRCLTRLGYLHYNRYNRTYAPTARVALLGSWVDPALFRGGAVIAALDRIGDALGATVALSTAINYVVQEVHVVKGASADAVDEDPTRTEHLMHSPQGKLLLSSYQDAHVRSALHRLNAEEADPERRVRIPEYLRELAEIRARGLIVDATYRDDGVGAIAMLLPQRCGAERLVLSILAPAGVITARSDEFVEKMLEERAKLQADAAGARPAPRPSAHAAPKAHRYEGGLHS